MNWLPPCERGRANGVLFSGSSLGAALAFPLLAWMLGRWFWRPSFFILGGLGVAWSIVWLFWFRDRPPGSGSLPQTGVSPSASPLRFFGQPGMALVMAQYFASNFTFFLCLSWMLPYLKEQYHLSDTRAAAYAMAPLLLGATAQWLSGWVVDAIYRSRWRAWSRRLPAMLAFVASTVAQGKFALHQNPRRLYALTQKGEQRRKFLL